MQGTTGERILFLLKTRGAQRAADLSGWLHITSAGVRQHLATLQDAGLVRFNVVAGSRGRPKHLWSLTAVGQARFPDRHSDVTLMLIEGIRAQLGEVAIEAVIGLHERRQLEAYAAEIESAVDASEATQRLAAIRSQEGYMAEVNMLPGGDILLIENHCPICAAAEACQGFCRAELSVFKAVLARFGPVEREEHLLSGARRCSYRLSQTPDVVYDTAGDAPCG